MNWWFYFVLTLWIGWTLFVFRTTKENHCFGLKGRLFDTIVLGIMIGGLVSFLLWKL